MIFLKRAFLFCFVFFSFQKGGKEETKRKHTLREAYVIAGGSFEWLPFQKLYIINGVLDDTQEWGGEIQKPVDRICYFSRTLSKEHRNGDSNCYLNIDNYKQGILLHKKTIKGTRDEMVKVLSYWEIISIIGLVFQSAQRS